MAGDEQAGSRRRSRRDRLAAKGAEAAAAQTGAPVNQEFADAIGADGFAADAPGAVELARRMIGAE